MFQNQPVQDGTGTGDAIQISPQTVKIKIRPSMYRLVFIKAKQVKTNWPAWEASKWRL